MPAHSQVVEFDPDHPADVLVLMRRILESGDGWLNVEPAVAVEAIPAPPGVFGKIFGARGPVIPLASWVPAATTADGATTERTSLGIQHGLGAPALPHLRELELWPHPLWQKLTDNARRGLVVLVPREGELDEQLDWLVTASLALTRVEMPNDWRATRFV